MADHGAGSDGGDDNGDIEAGVLREERVDGHEEDGDSEGEKTETVEAGHVPDGALLKDGFFALGVGEIFFAENGFDPYNADGDCEDYSCYSADCK